MRHFFVITICSVTALLGGCARQISPNVYSESSIGETSETFRGRIVAVRDIQVEGKEKLENNSLGLLGGGVAGGLVGNQFGGGSGNLAATVAGAAAGAIGGAFLQKELEKQVAVEYTVQLVDGRLKTVVQGPDNRYSINQNVLLIVYQKGRSRIVPDQSGL